MEEYEATLDNSESVDFSVLDPRLCRPRLNDLEPELSPEALQELDCLADEIEISRLKALGVLLSPTVHDGLDAPPVQLSTRMVRTWRDKEDQSSNPVWYRRSRYVAREYSWLDQHTDLFSPASTGTATKLIPLLVMAMRVT